MGVKESGGSMGKTLVILTFLAALCCPETPAKQNPPNPRVLFVSMPASGSPPSSGSENGSNQYPFSTIQSAVDAASPGDTIRVKKGVYHNSGFGTSDSNGPAVLISKGGNAGGGSLTLQAEPGVVIEYDGNGGILGAQDVSYVTIKNFVVKGPASAISESVALRHRLDNPALPKYKGEGISFPGPSHHIEILNNVVSDACGSGIRVNKGDYITIQGNTVSNSTGCTASASSALVIAEAANVDDSDAVKITIQGNKVFDNRNRLPFYAPNGFPPGAHPPFESYGRAESTYIIDGSGIYLTRNIQSYSHGKFLIADNLAYGNGINGMVVHYTDRAILQNNTIANNGTVPLSAGRQRNSGLVMNHSQDIEIVNNRVQVNVAGDWAIRFFGETTGIKASGNQFAGGQSDLKVGAIRVPNIKFSTELP
jgi:parallel beta-helix repeat protein